MQDREVSDRRLRLLTDSLPFAVAYLGATKHFFLTNRAFDVWLGAPSVEDDAASYFAGVFSPSFEEFMNRGLEDHQPLKTLVYSNRSVGKSDRLWLHVLPDVVDGQSVGAFVMLEPLEGTERMASPVVSQPGRMAHLQRMARLGEIMAGMAHEVRQPLSAIVNYADALPSMLDGDQPPGRIHSVVRALRAQARRASRIITQTRELVGGRQGEFRECDLLQVIYNSVELTEQLAGDGGVEVRVSAQSPLPPCEGNPAQIEQILVNLIGNAVEAVAHGASRVVRVQAENIENRAIRIRVTDSGPGIDAEALQSIFEAFSSGGDGMGMGLFVSRQLAEAHGGQLWAEPDRDDGASFVLDLPASRSQQTFGQSRTG